jgi:hypothetical protein
MFEDFVKPFQINFEEVLSPPVHKFVKIIIWSENGYPSGLLYFGINALHMLIFSTIRRNQTIYFCIHFSYRGWMWIGDCWFGYFLLIFLAQRHMICIRKLWVCIVQFLDLSFPMNGTYLIFLLLCLCWNCFFSKLIDSFGTSFSSKHRGIYNFINAGRTIAA